MGRLTPDRIDVTTMSDSEPRYIYTYDGEVVWSESKSGDIKCEYCGLYGELGRCEGCGAPNSPAKESR